MHFGTQDRDVKQVNDELFESRTESQKAFQEFFEAFSCLFILVSVTIHATLSSEVLPWCTHIQHKCTWCFFVCALPCSAPLQLGFSWSATLHIGQLWVYTVGCFQWIIHKFHASKQTLKMWKSPLLSYNLPQNPTNENFQLRKP